MTTKFETEEAAKEAACRYAGVTMDALNGVVPKQDRVINPVFSNLYEDIETYTIRNCNGEEATFAIGRFRDGYDLWLVGDNGMMLRV